jgi:signal transduction histidine kinase
MLTGSFPSPRPDSEIGFETQLVRRDGERVPVSVATSELRDRQGLSIGLVVVVRDLREVHELRHRLVTSARLAAVGELAAGIAHEINNPIAYVRANLTQLQAHWKQVEGEIAGTEKSATLAEAFDEAGELLLTSLEGVDRAAEIVRGVKSFAHAGSIDRETADINQLLDDVLRMAGPQMRARVTIERRFEELRPVACSPQELKQVFLNLVLNAGQAMESGGHLWIATRWDGDAVVVRVEDDGPGIPPEILDRIFDPFFTTKKVGEGTGLGLGIAYQIIRAHGGEIAASSDPGEGAVFTVRLPADPATVDS